MVTKNDIDVLLQEGMNQKQAAEKLGVHPSTVSRHLKLAEQPLRRSDAVKEMGGVGQSQSSLFNTLIQDEYLIELKWPRSIDIYDKMRKSDAQAQAMLLVMELPLRSTKWYIKPFSDEAKDIEIAETIEENLFAGPPNGMTIHWDDFLRVALTMLPFGHAVFEKVFELKNGYLKWRKLAQRPQRTIYDFIYDEQGGPEAVRHLKIKGPSYEFVDIPIEKLLVFSYRQEAGDLKGQSILRSAYKHWKIKDFLYQITNVGIERNYVGTPTISLPEQYSHEDYEKAKRLVEELRSDEKSGAVIPSGFILDIFEGKRGFADALPYIEHHDVMMVRSILAQFINLGSKEVGSYALSSDQSDMFLMCLNATAEYIKNTINSYAIPQLVEYNWQVQGYPTINFEPIGKESQKLIDILNSLVAGKLIVPDNNIEEWLRNMLDLPEKGEPTQAAPPTVLKERPARNFDEQGERRWKRDLTVWEKQVNLEEIERVWDSEEEKYINEGKELTDKQIEALFKRMQKEVEEGNYAELAKIPIAYRPAFGQFMGTKYKTLLDYGKEQASGELGIEAEAVPTSREATRIANARAEVAADQVSQRIKARAILTVLGALEEGRSAKDALYRARQAAMEIAERELRGTASAQISEAINEGRKQAADKAQPQVAQFSAILDDVTCPLCAWMDGLIIELANPDYEIFTPPIHQHCRCVWVYIRPDEEPQPEPTWQTPPTGLVEQHGSLIFKESCH